MFNDLGYGVLRRFQDTVYNRRAAVDLLSPDFVLFGKSLGVETTEITSSEGFIDELEAAVARRKPSMIVVNMNIVGSVARPFTPSQK